VRSVAEHARGDEVLFTVTGAQHYGILIQTDSGERGWVEEEYLSDRKLRREEWPPVGVSLRGLVLGYARDGRIRVCLRDVDGRTSPDRWPSTSVQD
jgi:hypothetical protein